MDQDCKGKGGDALDLRRGGDSPVQLMPGVQHLPQWRWRGHTCLCPRGFSQPKISPLLMPIDSTIAPLFL